MSRHPYHAAIASGFLGAQEVHLSPHEAWLKRWRGNGIPEGNARRNEFKSRTGTTPEDRKPY